MFTEVAPLFERAIDATVTSTTRTRERCERNRACPIRRARDQARRVDAESGCSMRSEFQSASVVHGMDRHCDASSVPSSVTQRQWNGQAPRPEIGPLPRDATTAAKTACQARCGVRGGHEHSAWRAEDLPTAGHSSKIRAVSLQMGYGWVHDPPTGERMASQCLSIPPFAVTRGPQWPLCQPRESAGS